MGVLPVPRTGSARYRLLLQYLAEPFCYILDVRDFPDVVSE